MKRPREVLLLYALLVLSITLLLIVAVFVNKEFINTYNNFQMVNRENHLIGEVNNIETVLLDAGAAARSYIVTQDINEFAKFQKDRERTVASLNALKELTTGDITQTELVDSLHNFFESRFALWNHLISLGNSINDSTRDELTVRSYLANRDILRVGNSLKSNEKVLLDSYVSITEQGIKTAGIMSGGITLFCVSIILFAFFKLSGEIKKGIIIQAQLQTKVEELDRSNADLERFAYVASHDLHEPLRKLYAFSGMLMESEQRNLSANGIDIMNRMQGFVVRMQKLIDDLLNFSRNFKKIDSKSIDLNKILREVKNDLSVNITKTGTTIHADALPTMMGYESQLRQLLQNIISNSIRYAKPDVAPVIKITNQVVSGEQIPNYRSPEKQKKFYKLTFIDNGIGFDNQYAEKIFVIFQRLHGKSEYEGTGIGLATCKLVVENHGGYIFANGRPDEGAEFVVYLPVT